jgi:hypothetical protein
MQNSSHGNGAKALRYRRAPPPASCSIVLERTIEQPGDASSLKLAVVRRIGAGQHAQIQWQAEPARLGTPG